MLRKRWKRQIFSMILAIVLTLGEIPVPAQVAYAAEISEETGETEAAEETEAALSEGTLDGGEEEEAEILIEESVEEAYPVATADVGLWTDGLTADADYAFGGGTGTAEDPYQISTPEHLAMIALNVNSGKKNYNGVYFALQANLDLNGKYWVPIGKSDSVYFYGSFDGRNHIIQNMTVDISKDSSITSDPELFGRMTGGATI